jgi:hypothetical protein
MAKNYKRFYALLKKNPDADKDELVMSFTDERTTSLKEMTEEEFNALCDALQYGAGQGYGQRAMEELKAARSAVLVRLQRLGIETADNWAGIDQFCLSKRIAGKRFAAMNVDELNALRVKLEMIRRRGGLKNTRKREEEQQAACLKAFSQAWMTTGKPKYAN